MPRGLLPEHIGPLVDRLRSGDHQALSLPDVAALTEVLMRSLESYFKTVDLTIYAECQSLADYMEDAKSEIASLTPGTSEDDVGTHRAGLELAAIVESTENATNTIMNSAERIMDADSEDIEAYKDTVNDAVMQIFEACSFQDITGQRISKVVSTLVHVEERVAKLVNILGVLENPDAKANKTEEPGIVSDEDLLNGPALEGEGIDQSEIDALLNGESPSQPEAEAQVEIEPEDDTIEFEEEAEVQPEPQSDIETVSSIAAEAENSTPEIAPETALTEDNLAVDTLKVSNLTVENLAVETLISSEEAVGKPAEEAVEEAVGKPAEEAVEEAVGKPAEEAVEEAVEKPVEEEPEHATAEDIDSMFDSPTEEEPVEDVSSAPEEEEEKPNLIEEAKARKAQAKAEKKAKAAPPKPAAYEEDAKAGLSPKSSENTTQSDIDALFS